MLNVNLPSKMLIRNVQSSGCCKITSNADNIEPIPNRKIHSETTLVFPDLPATNIPTIYCQLICVALHFSEGWVKTDVGYVVSQWLEKRYMKSHFVQIECNTCATERQSVPVAGTSEMEHTLKPFIVIHTMALPHKMRSRRYSDCLPGMKECCRDKLYINFASIGWSDWILHPSGYHAYFCRGSCSSAGSLTSATLYNNVIRVCFSWNFSFTMHDDNLKSEKINNFRKV